MKKLLLFATLSTTTFFASCNNDDDSNVESHEELLIGKWQIKNSGYYLNGKEIIEEYNECDSKTNITFNKNFTYYNDFYEGGGNDPCYHSPSEGKWSLKNKRITLTENNTNDTEIENIEILTKNSLRISFGDEDAFFINYTK